VFKAELKHIEEHGDYCLLYQQSKPHLVVHVQLPQSEAEFDNILGWCLGQNKWCDYIEGNLSFICVVAGFNAAELTPKYPDFIKERVYALYDAVYWWNEYGSECLKSNEKPSDNDPYLVDLERFSRTEWVPNGNNKRKADNNLNSCCLSFFY